MKRIIEKMMPADRFLMVLFALVFNSAVYSGAHIIARGWNHHVMTSALDAKIPLIPESLIVYFGCYIFWVWNYTMIAKLDERRAYAFYAADFLSRVVCFIIFLLFPTTNIRPEIVGNGFWEEGMRFLYSVDAADNLFPSIHCLVSWFCYIGIRKVDTIPRWYRNISCMIAILVFISTLTTKQHVIWDVIGGIFLAELSFFVANHTKIAWYYEEFWTRITQKIFCERRKLHEK